MEGIVVPIVFFGFLGAIILVPTWLRERTKQSAHKLISQAIERGQTLDPSLLERLTDTPQKQVDRPRRTLGSGVVLIALAIGLGAASFLSNGFDYADASSDGMILGATILGALGLGFLILAIVDYAGNRKKADV
ncbi:MAG: DUF6249 domain-containing protein [Hyphomonadaceae bacterium]|nr:DUF6249 domain-containing protein [Hyphomonadaceae bacterium]